MFNLRTKQELLVALLKKNIPLSYFTDEEEALWKQLGVKTISPESPQKKLNS